LQFYVVGIQTDFHYSFKFEESTYGLYEMVSTWLFAFAGQTEIVPFCCGILRTSFTGFGMKPGFRISPSRELGSQETCALIRLDHAFALKVSAMTLRAQSA
jgi:hypothetical protein